MESLLFLALFTAMWVSWVFFKKSASSNLEAVKTEAEECPVYTMESWGEFLEVYEDKVTIAPKGVMGFFSRGHKGMRTFPFYSISGIEWRKPGVFGGSLHFMIPGGSEPKGAVSRAFDSTAFLYQSGSQNKLALEIKEYIEEKIRELHSPKSLSSNLSDELQKLADMKEKGLLSGEEFQAAKRRLIG